MTPYRLTIDYQGIDSKCYIRVFEQLVTILECLNKALLTGYYLNVYRVFEQGITNWLLS